MTDGTQARSGPGADLRRRWAALVERLGLDRDAAERLGDELIDVWDEPHRSYHDLRHLAAVLEALDAVAAPTMPSPEALLAAWFHDAVYEGRADVDEEDSARLAEERLPAVGLDPGMTAHVAAMVRATAGHLDPSAGHVVDTPTAQLLDADLSILGAAPERYDDYARGVRAEHPDVPDDAFRAGRTRVLRTLLDRPQLFRTARGRSLWEEAARRNLQRELSSLADPSARPGRSAAGD